LWRGPALADLRAIAMPERARLVVVAMTGGVEPVQRSTPGLRRGVRVEAGPGVVEEGVIGLGEREELVPQPSRLECRLGRRAGRVDTCVESAVDPEHRRAGTREVAALRERPVEGRGRAEAPFACGEQAPHHAAAEAEPDRGQLLAADATLELGHAGFHVGDET